jgi:beta-xylosidase
VAGSVYAGDFPDPTVIVINRRYYASSTNSDGVNVPTLVSGDLRTWRAMSGTAANPTGDVLRRLPTWAAGSDQPDGRRTGTVWAPSVARLGPGRYVMAYSVRQAGGLNRMCISVATGRGPAGPFTDASTGPVVCPPRGGIDPQVFLAPTGRPWLVWKVDLHPAQLVTQPMDLSGTRVLDPRGRRLLARITETWEGSIIENPAMIRHRGRYYLFYSGNSYDSTRYAVGYLVCRTWYGGCRRDRHRPLLASGGAIAGPGGATPFVDNAGRLRLAYHAWRTGNVGYPDDDSCLGTAQGCPQRRLYVATVRADHTGTLRVVHRR